MSKQQHSDTGCFHCGLPVPSGHHFDAEIEGQTQAFCCLGCQSVCKIIYESGLQGFYQRTPEGQLLAPPPEPPKDITLYDIDEVQSEFITSLEEIRDIHLLVEGIHCAACVWLIERSLSHLPGIISVKPNLANRRLHIRWHNDQIKLSEIINRLSQIGYAAVPFDPESAEGVIKKQNRALLLRMAFAGFAMMNLLWVSIALYTGADEGEFRQMFEWIGFALATPTLFYSGWPFLKGAWTGIKQLHLGMDLPIAIGASTTYSYSIYVMLSQSQVGDVYFDTVVNFIFVILVGRFLEAKSKRHAISATQRLLDLQPRIAHVIRNGETETVPIRSVKQGETVLIKAGDKIPVDGIVINGTTSINESMLTGESSPVKKDTDHQVYAGTVNIESSIQVKVESTLRNTTLGKIISLVEEAQASKAPIQCTADKIVPWFVATTLLLATITFTYWMNTDFELALMAATSVLIITCPCAFGLATPMAIAVASGLGARDGILVKNGAVLEYLSEINHFVFDKTGTLTEGKMSVKDIDTDGIEKTELLELAAHVELFSEHAIARAIVNNAKENAVQLDTNNVNEFINNPGFGVQANVNGQTVILGTLAWLEQHTIQSSPVLQQRALELEQQGNTCVHVAVNGQQQGLIAVADKLRPDARQLVQHLRDQNIKITLLSGDRKAVAEAIASELGGMNVIAEVVPDEKDQVIQDLQQSGDKVAMVGDGVNDAPALIRADVGIAVGSGTDVSMESSDIVLLSDELNKVYLASQLSRRTLTTIKQNIAISISYNIIMIPLAMMAFITPLFAAIAMPISSLAV
ncbi:MAG: heavy metal translocating P-type ATPase, partial [Gammaproteobacteria bacterium]|nr:heavy metal translocating P-type ATPase [Gammaproteobacteria bacterium]